MNTEPEAEQSSDSEAEIADINYPPLSEPKGKRAAKTRGKASDIEFAHIIEKINEGFMALDAQMNYIYINRRASELLQRKPEDLIGKNYWEEYPQDKDTSFGKAYLQVLETQTPTEVEDYYVPRDRWFENRIYPSESGLSIFFNDITERKRLEDERSQLLQSERAQRAGAEQAQAAAEQELAQRKLAEQALGTWARNPLPHEARPVWMGYGVAAIATALAILLRVIFQPVIGDFAPLVTLFGAVAFSVWYGGVGPALFSVIAGYIGAEWFIMEPIYSISLSPAHALGLVLFLLSSLIIMGLGEEKRRAQHHAHQSAQVAIARRDQLQLQLAEQKRIEDALRIANEKSERTRDRIARLQQITVALAGSMTPSKLAETVLEQSTQASDAVAGILVELLDNGQEIQTVAALGYPSAAVRTEPVPLSAPTPMSDCIRTKQAVWIRSQAEFAEQYPAIAEFRRSLGNEATAALPLIVEDKVVGGLAFSFVEVQEFEEDEQSFFLAVAQRCAQTLERARAEALFRTERETLERLVETMPVMMSMYYPETNSMRFNAEFERALGWKSEEVTVLSILEGLYPDPEYRNQVLQRMATAGQNDWVEVQVQTRDGRMLDSLWANISIMDGEQIIRGIALGIDITERKKAETKLRQSEERERVRAAQLETLMEAVPAAIWVAHDAEAQLVAGNRASYEILHLPIGGNASLSAPEGVRPTNFQVLHNGQVMQPEELPVQRAARGEEVYGFEEELRFDDGTSVYLLGNAITLRDEQNNPSGAVAAFVDITARKHIEEALRESEERFQAILRQATAGIVRKDVAGRLIFVNLAFCNMLGYTEAELLGKTIWEFTHAEDIEENKRLYDRAMLEGIPFKLERRMIRSDGSIIWVDASISPIMDTTGKPQSAVTVEVDITGRKQAEQDLQQLNLELEGRVETRTAELLSANKRLKEEIEERAMVEEALRESDETTRLILDTSPDVIVIADKQGRIRRINAQIEKLFGYQAQEVLGRPIEMLLPERFHERHVEHRSDYSKSPHRRPMGRGMELFGQPKDRAEFSVDVMLTPIRNIGDWDTMVTIRDSTERKQMEDALRESHKRLQNLSQRLVEVQEEERSSLARELHDSVGQSLAALNLNLTIINNQLSTFVNEQVKERLSDSVSLVLDVIALVRDLISNLRPSVLDDYGLEAALQMTLDKFNARYGIGIRFDKSESLVPRLGSSIEMTLFRIAQEGLLNAARHAQANQVALSLQLEEQAVHLTIHDNGIGIQQETSRPGSHGMKIMRERAEAVGGNLQILSTPGNGTQIEVSIPIQNNRLSEENR
jgi:PAS domain S-box-containing protein